MQHQTDHYSRRVGPGWICFSAGLEMWQTQGGELGAPWHGAGCAWASEPWAVSPGQCPRVCSALGQLWQRCRSKPGL